jgi:MFS transporter, ACS family, aldohexuronate transporter
MDSKIAADAQAGDDSSLGERVGNVRWTICALLFAATTLNYMDRMVLGLLKPTIQHSIGMTELDYAYVVDAFQVAYAVGMLVMGRLIDRVGTRIGYLVVMCLWSLSAWGHALANTVLEFGIARFCLGFGESGNFPVAIKTVAEWFPQKERSLATGIFNSGTNLGAIIAPLAVPWVVLTFHTWHAGFLITGVFSTAWIILWLIYYRKPSEHPKIGAAELKYINEGKVEPPKPTTTWLELFAYRQTWAFFVGKFLTDPIWWFYLFWLPSYFTSKFHLKLSTLGLPLMIVYTAATVGSIFGGWLPAPFLKMGMSVARARTAAMLSCACAVIPIFLVAYTKSEWAAVGLLSLATAAHQGWSANLFTTVSDMFPRTEVASVTGIGGTAGALGGVVIASTAGFVLQYMHTYAPLFYIAASAYVVAWVLITILAPGLRKAEIAA